VIHECDRQTDRQQSDRTGVSIYSTCSIRTTRDKNDYSVTACICTLQPLLSGAVTQWRCIQWLTLRERRGLSPQLLASPTTLFSPYASSQLTVQNSIKSSLQSTILYLCKNGSRGTCPSTWNLINLTRLILESSKFELNSKFSEVCCFTIDLVSAKFEFKLETFGCDVTFCFSIINVTLLPHGLSNEPNINNVRCP